MKKAIIILGAVLFLYANESKASTHNFLVKNQIEIAPLSNSPLHVAISKGDITSVKKIIEYGADVNKLSKDLSPLMLAAHYKNVEIIKILLSHGAEPLMKNEKGFTALNYAQFSKATDCITILKDFK